MNDLAPSSTAPRLAALEAQALDEIHGRGDRLMTALIAAHTLLALAMAPAYGTWLVTLLVAPLAASMFLVARHLAPRSFATRAVAGIALQTFCALHIYQYHGLAEQHFWFFTSTTAMLVYQDVLALWPGVLLIIAQHVLFATLHNSGVELYFFEQSHVGTVKLAYHFGIALVQTALVSFVAHGLRRRTLSDVALRHDLEHARASAEDAMRARTMFLASMSHEIRTPMNGIEGMADVLIHSELREDQRECVETIRSSSRALLAVVGDVLDFSRIESGRLELERRPFDPLELAVQVGRLLRPRALENDVSIDVVWGDRPPRHALGDADRVRQVLLNLVGNAAKFARGGEVRVRVSSEPAAGRSWLVLEVVDDGIGIAPEALERIFDPFEQADRSTGRRFGGTGLGLAITHRLVTLMGGELSVESEPGVGSTFRVRLPLEVDPDRAAVEESGERPLDGRTVHLARGAAAPGLARAVERLGGRIVGPGVPADLVVERVERGEFDARSEAASEGRVLLVGTAARPAEGAVCGTTTLLCPFLPEEFGRALSVGLGLERGASRGPSDAAPRPFDGLEVLVVEDNPVNRKVARRLLTVLGCRPTFAENGRIGLERLEAARFDLVLMDCQMPELDGYETTAAWRECEARRALPRTPILALTASAVEGERERCAAAGMDDCLTKPIALEGLRAAFERHLVRGARP